MTPKTKMAQPFLAELGGTLSLRPATLCSVFSPDSAHPGIGGEAECELDASRCGACCVLRSDVCGGCHSPVTCLPDFTVVNKR